MDQIIVGSLGNVAKNNNQALSSAFMSVKAFVMVDVSASMGIKDAGTAEDGSGKMRYSAAVEQLALLQNENAGEIAVGCFSDRAQFCPSGVPFFMNKGTNMMSALRLLKMADACGIRLVIISDGEPDDRQEALNFAQTFISKIDTIFVGNETGSGREFLQQLSMATGGISIVNQTKDLNLLNENMTRLIGA